MPKAQIAIPESYDIPYQDAKIKVPAGLVVVQMIQPVEKQGSIYIPDSVSERYRPDVGIVLGSGPENDEMCPGCMVIVYPKDGSKQYDVELGYMAKEIRIFGRDQRFAGESQKFPWHDSIPLTYNDHKMVATANNVLIRRQPMVETQNGIFLPDSQKYVPCDAVIESIGPKAHFGIPVKEGTRCNYTPRGVMEFGLGGDPDLVVVRDIDINFIYTDG